MIDNFTPYIVFKNVTIPVIYFISYPYHEIIIRKLNNNDIY
jgi:hypothetical protein